ncbi:MAG: hypothetical protein ACREUR_11915 [Nitrosospira sp.]
MENWRRGLRLAALSLAGWMTAQAAAAQELVAPNSTSPETLFRDVRVLDVIKGQLSAPTNVLIVGDRIARIGHGVTARGSAKIEGAGRTLMPGMIDVHVHLTFSALTMPQMLSPSGLA